MEKKIQEREISQEVHDELMNMIREDPDKMIKFMMLQMGNKCVRTNSESIEIKMESTINGQRYETTAVIKVKKI